MKAQVTDISVQSLVRAGFQHKQATALMQVMNRQILTKEHFDEIVQEIRKEIQDVRSDLTEVKRELKDDIKDVRNELTSESLKMQLAMANRHNTLLLQIAGLLGLSITILKFIL